MPLISRATHFSSHNPTCIDHILVNVLDGVNRSGIIKFSFNHHFPVFLNLEKIGDVHNDVAIKPNLRINEYTLNQFKSDLNEISSKLDPSLSGEQSFSYFINNFRNRYDNCFLAPIEEKAKFKKQNNLRKEWITIGLAKSSSVKNALHSTWCANKNAKKLEFLHNLQTYF